MERKFLWMSAVGLGLLLLALPAWAQQEQAQPQQPEAQQPAENATDNTSDNPVPNENEITIPEGTEFKLQLHSTVSSKTSRSGDRILTTLLDPVAVEDQDVTGQACREGKGCG